ncbi:MAG: protein adenylyltransferase SelO family protein [Desulfobacterales bacterium]
MNWHTIRRPWPKYFQETLIIAGADPIATAYAGHQFGSFVPQLGDGRAHLLGEVIDQSGHRWDIQLKGSGPTSFSRGRRMLRARAGSP